MTDKRVVDFLRTALRKLNQDWPRSVNLRTPLWSRLTMFCHPSIPILMHHMCCGAPSGLKVIMTSSVPLGLIPGAQPLNFAKSFRVPIFPAIEQKSIFQVLSYTEYLCGTKTEWLVKSRKINITPLSMTDKRVVDFLRTALRKLNQDWPRSVNLRTPLWSRLTMFCHPSIPILMHHMCCGVRPAA